ncbi:MacS family sensor histidine kinase [Nocardioides aquiterrae]|uniref:MacS family sensor histidine kinase n=1 Tax=Nocardioides aquiterrae TaxID=203799 RepID=UPI0031E2C6CC
MSSWTSPASIAVKDRMFRALAVLRIVLLVNAVAFNLYHAADYAHPIAAAACVAAMVLWTGFATWAYADKRRRGFPLLTADLALAVALTLATPWVKGPDLTASLPGFWIMGALFAWAIHYRLFGGLAAGVLLAAADLARQEIDASDYGNAFLLILGGAIVGFMCDSLQLMATERDAAERESAMAAERARLARIVHDGVLQVLALVQRRAPELGGEAAELGRLAGEQERALRELIRAQDAVTTVHGDATADLASELARLGSRTVTVATPGTPVEVPAPTAREVVAATRSCLDNVRVHVGEHAPAWVLLQAFPDRVEVSVRDDGPGIPAGRLDQAATEGRLGIVESIRGRIADLGGTAELATGDFGTEWEIVVPRTDDLGSAS